MTASNTSTSTFTPLAVHENATPDPNEVLVAGVDEQGVPRNILLRDRAGLRATLIATPAMIPNPDRPAVEAEAFSAAIAVHEAHLNAIAEAEANARAAAEAAAKAEAETSADETAG